MIKQTILPFKLEISKDLITSHAGLGLLGEFAVGLGLNKALDEYLPGPGNRMPSSDATGDWLRRSWRNGGLEGLGRVNRMVLKRVLKREKVKGYTLDIDATAIESEKESAKMTYKGFRGYMPIVGHLAENGLVVGDGFREGNDSPGSRNLDCSLQSRHYAA